MSSKPEPILPQGNASVWAGISENFSFHASLEAFIAQTVAAFHRDNPEAVSKRIAVRAKILNRNVAIVSSYHQIVQVLNAEEQESNDPPYVAAAPYARLMEPFFPPPNLLLTDGCPHAQMRKPWEGYASRLLDQQAHSNLVDLARGSLTQLPRDRSFDLYEAMKDIAWDLLLYAFLEMSREDADFALFVKLQEYLLRGQFSLLPISMNTGFWHSPRKVGINARKKLQVILSNRLSTQRPKWVTELPDDARPQDEIAHHLLMATGSLAVKGFASLLTAIVLNVFVWRSDVPGSHSLASWVDSGSAEERSSRRASLLKETLRPSAPIVGVMRRSTRELRLFAPNDPDPDTLVPSGWDTWTYFPGGNRDSSVFGSNADLFQPDRYMGKSNAPPTLLSFGVGPKQCLGSRFTYDCAQAVLEAFFAESLSIVGEVDATGVRGWLGWQVASPEEWAADIKQLPTQRPSRPVYVRLQKE